MPQQITAIHFYLTSPTSKTLLLKIVSQVIEKCYITRIFNNKETIHVIIVSPADKPSFLVAPSEK